MKKKRIDKEVRRKKEVKRKKKTQSVLPLLMIKQM